jgi:hypothetical protein
MKALDLRYILTGAGLFALALLVLLITSSSASAGGSGDYPPPPFGDWTITTDTSVWDEAIELRGNVIVSSTGRLRSDNVTFVINGTAEGQYGITVQAPARIDFNSTHVTVVNTTNPSYVEVRDGGSLGLVDSTIEYMGWRDGKPGIGIGTGTSSISGSVIRNCYIGLETSGTVLSIGGGSFVENAYAFRIFDGAQVTISGSSFNNNTIGIFMEDSNLTLSGAGILDSTSKGIHAKGSNITAVETNVASGFSVGIMTLGSSITFNNGSISGGVYSVFFDDNSSLVCMNTTVEIYSFKFNDKNSWVSLYWFIDVVVKKWSDLSGIPGTDVRISDSFEETAGSGITGTDGRLQLVPLHLYFHNHTNDTLYTPHLFNVTTSTGLRANATESIEGYETVVIVVDDILPNVNITSPKDGGYINRTTFTVAGLAWDNETGPRLVEVRVDNGTWIEAAGTGMWNAQLSAVDGTHTIEVRIFDFAGNVVTDAIEITVDTVPPDLIVNVPIDGIVTKALMVTVKGTTEPGARVNISGIEVNVTAGSGAFSAQIEIVEGLNVLKISAKDIAGNVAFVELRVTRDTRLEPLVITPENGTWVNTTNLTMNGITELNATVLVRGAPVPVLNGNFTKTLSLHEGWNNITVKATDALGNTKTVSLFYFVDTLPPVLNLTSPKACKNIGNASVCHHYTNRVGVNIRGYTEENATVTINGQLMFLFGNEFSSRAEVELGLNNFTIRAMDAAGNIRTVLLQVLVDRTPPELNITSPLGKAKTKNDRFLIRGIAEPNATVKINGGKVPVGPNGEFEAYKTLVFGNNLFLVEATDQAGNPTNKTVVVIREAPPEDLTMFYIGIAAVIAIIVIGLVLGLWALNREGFLDPFKARLEERRAEKEEARLKEAFTAEGLPEPLEEPGGELPVPAETTKRFPWEKKKVEEIEEQEPEEEAGEPEEPVREKTEEPEEEAEEKADDPLKEIMED